MSHTRVLMRNMKIGEQLVLDGGRIVLRLEERSGQGARIRFELSEDVVVVKPGHVGRGVAGTGVGKQP